MKINSKYQIFYVCFIVFCVTSCSVASTTSSLFAKEVCSCMFVSNQDEEYCIDYGQPVFETSSYSINTEDKTVKARKLGSISKARYVSKRFGCQLID